MRLFIRTTYSQKCQTTSMKIDIQTTYIHKKILNNLYAVIYSDNCIKNNQITYYKNNQTTYIRLFIQTTLFPKILNNINKNIQMTLLQKC